jgi:hypothetical protein
MHTGEITKGLRPDWEPLITLVGREVVGCFAWKFALELDDGAAVHAYRNIATDRYLLLALTGGRSSTARRIATRRSPPPPRWRRSSRGGRRRGPGRGIPEAVRELLASQASTESPA